MKTLPLYGMPYLEGSDLGKDIPANSLKVAQQTEAALARGGAIPIGLDLQQLLARVSALESKPAVELRKILRRSKAGAQTINGAGSGATPVSFDTTDMDLNKATADTFTVSGGSIVMKRGGFIRAAYSASFNAPASPDSGRRSARLTLNGSTILESSGPGISTAGAGTVWANEYTFGTNAGDEIALAMGSSATLSVNSPYTYLQVEFIQS